MVQVATVVQIRSLAQELPHACQERDPVGIIIIITTSSSSHHHHHHIIIITSSSSSSPHHHHHIIIIITSSSLSSLVPYYPNIILYYFDFVPSSLNYYISLQRFSCVYIQTCVFLYSLIQHLVFSFFHEFFILNIFPLH